MHRRSRMLLIKVIELLMIRTAVGRRTTHELLCALDPSLATPSASSARAPCSLKPAFRRSVTTVVFSGSVLPALPGWVAASVQPVRQADSVAWPDEGAEGGD